MYSVEAYDARRELGYLIASNSQIKQINNNTWHVQSQTSSEVYEVTNIDDKIQCSCPDYRYRGFNTGWCKHIWAVRYDHASKERESDGKGNENTDVVLCKYCESSRLIKEGKRGKRVVRQIYYCKDCEKYFTLQDAFTKMKNDPKIISLALSIYFSGVSLRGVCRILYSNQGLKISHKTIYNWIDKYARMLTEYIRTLTPQFSGQINADELYIFIKKDMVYWFNAIDPETRYLLASVISEKKDIDGARAVFEEANRTIKNQRLLKVVTDGLAAYRRAYKKVFWSRDRQYREHQVAVRLSGDMNNNIMERMNNTIRDREKTFRRLKSMASPIFTMYPIYYNFIRKHDALNELTPAEAAGVGSDLGDNKWLGLIEKAHEQNSTEISQNKDWEKIDSYFERSGASVEDKPIERPNLTYDFIQMSEVPEISPTLTDVFIDAGKAGNQSQRIMKGWKQKGWL